MPFSNQNKNYKIQYKVTVMVIFNSVITIHKYEDSNVDFNILLFVGKLGNCVISHARPLGGVRCLVSSLRMLYKA